ncbi:MAG TPA: diguanylate cyclase [Frankiaceae bacterium]|nr:diguanylate cyclase [Frankiaceae bacterium]
MTKEEHAVGLVPSTPAQRDPAGREAGRLLVRQRPAGEVAAEQLFEQVFERAPISTALLAPDGRWLRVNAAFCELLGRTEDDLLAGSWKDITHPDDLEQDEALLRLVLVGASDGHRLEKRYVRSDGAVVWVLRAVSLVRGVDAAPKLCIAQMVDITDRKNAEKELIYAATHDPLTQLCNRARFSDALEGAVARAERYAEPVALLLVDLDGFKNVNDRHGHAVGDETLKQAAAALTEATRATDTCARLGGDELAVLLPCTGRDDARVAGRRVVEAIRHCTHGTVTASVGLVQASAGVDLAGWLRQADAAMYEAKRAGGDRLVEFDAC